MIHLHQPYLVLRPFLPLCEKAADHPHEMYGKINKFIECGSMEVEWTLV
jgi:hypothetical protein